MDAGALSASWDLAAVAEVVYLDPAGAPHVAAVTPLLLDGRPALALPGARSALARALARSPSVALVLSDSRLAYRGWEPMAAGGVAHVEADPEGVTFGSHLLDQELRKHPPSRDLLDTPVLRREHWWYLPRWIVRVACDHVRPVGRRPGPGHGVLAYAAHGRIEVDTVAVPDWEANRISLRSLTGRSGTQVRTPAVLFTHDFTVPDLDRWVEQSAAGELRRMRLHVHERTGTRALPRPLTLLARWRRLRDLERACRRELPPP